MAKNLPKSDKWMPLWIGDYLADTQHLTRDEHGAYFLLMMAYWRNGGPLLDDPKRLAATVKATPQEWKSLRPTLAEFFSISDGMWNHKRIDREIANSVSRITQRSEAGKLSALKRWGNGNGNEKVTSVITGDITDTVTGEVTKAVTKGLRNCKPSPSPSVNLDSPIQAEEMLTTGTEGKPESLAGGF